ncbi:MAG TPA: acyltransferase [Terriglobales bacterium]
MEPTRRRLPALTSLRFFAALHVVIFHLFSMHLTQGPGWYRKLSSIGYVGVGLFFVLSGFILVYTYAGRGTRPLEFWRARFARIYPAYLFSLLVTTPTMLFITLMMTPEQTPPFFAWIKQHVLISWLLPPVLLQSWVPHAAIAWNTPAWSLSVEAFFYAIFPVLLIWLMKSRNRGLWMGVAAAWGASLAITCAYVFLKPDGVAYVDDQSFNLFWLDTLKFFPMSRLPEFILGACLGVLFLRQSVDRKWGTPLVLSGLAVFVLVVAFSPQIPYPILHDSALTLAFAATIYGLALRPKWCGIFEVRPLVLLGDASYSLYLLHGTVIGIYFSPFNPSAPTRHTSLLGVIGGIAICVAISIAVYLFIEEPARRWLRPKEKKQPPVAVEAAQAW